MSRPAFQQHVPRAGLHFSTTSRPAFQHHEQACISATRPTSRPAFQHHEQACISAPRAGLHFSPAFQQHVPRAGLHFRRPTSRPAFQHHVPRAGLHFSTMSHEQACISAPCPTSRPVASTRGSDLRTGPDHSRTKAGRGGGCCVRCEAVSGGGAREQSQPRSRQTQTDFYDAIRPRFIARGAKQEREFPGVSRVMSDRCFRKKSLKREKEAFRSVRIAKQTRNNEPARSSSTVVVRSTFLASLITEWNLYRHTEAILHYHTTTSQANRTSVSLQSV